MRFQRWQNPSRNEVAPPVISFSIFDILTPITPAKGGSRSLVPTWFWVNHPWSNQNFIDVIPSSHTKSLVVLPALPTHTGDVIISA